MQKLVFILSLLVATSVSAKPLERPVYPHLHEVTPIVTNVRPNSVEHTYLVRAIDTINSMLQSPVLKLKDEVVPSKHIFNPMIEGVVFLDRHTLSNVLGMFVPNLLGFVHYFVTPLRPKRIKGPTAVIDGSLPDYVLKDVVLHEMLHFVGVPHTGDANDIMFPHHIQRPKKIGIYTKLELYARYHLKDVYNKEIQKWLEEQEKSAMELLEGQEIRKRKGQKQPKPSWETRVHRHTCSGGTHRVKVKKRH